VFTFFSKEQVIGINGQGGTLATGCDVFLPEVADRDDTGCYCQVIAIADLECCVTKVCLFM
jgi:hypothetical protein